LSSKQRIYLSPPVATGCESSRVNSAIDSGWIAPVGPDLDAFESEFALVVGAGHAVGLSSGTAALHLALLLAGVKPGDEVFVSTFTFCASVNPILYCGATPVFIDSESRSWNLDPSLLESSLKKRAENNRLPKVVIVVHVYGQIADMNPILEICERYGIALIEDAAESLGATYKSNTAGSMGTAGIFSFNGNKIITTSGGGMLVLNDADQAARARKLSTQARDDAAHYQHSEVGYNYRLSNILAALGRAQLATLDSRLADRQRVFKSYQRGLINWSGIAFMPDAGWGIHTRWLTCLTIDPVKFGADRETVRLELEKNNIESRPLWKPMHLQPVYSGYESIGGQVSESLFEDGLCLPSGGNLSQNDIDRVISIIVNCSNN
jgi:dTDP-4-amino-4,6-dideoxygalactose transaminase